MLLLVLFVISFLFQIGTSVRVEFSNGIVEGVKVKTALHNVHVFKNVPFAEPPIAELRFQSPRPEQLWHGVRDGTKYARPCMSNTTFTTSPQKNVSEDCLYLNIFADDRCLRKVCPVLFYIHGGNFYYDSAVMFNDTEIINKYASDEMVFVIPAYRMGIFGFMDLGQELKDAPYNVGFQDIIMALRWVQKEIRAVGGDSKRITCMGNSGGGTAVEYLMVSPVLEPNTFEKVIIESGIASFSPHVNLKMTKLTIEKIGCDKNKNGTELSIHERLQCLKNKSSHELSDATQTTELQWTGIGPQTDNLLFPAESYIELLNKYFKATPMLITATKDEMVEEARGRNFRQICQHTLSEFGYQSMETIDACVEFYTKNRTSDITRDSFHAFTVKMAIENSRRGQPAFVGIFAQINHTRHANDLTYFFGLHPIANMTEDDKLMDSYYPKIIKQFIKMGQPVPDWKPVNPNGTNYYYLDFERNKSIVPHLVENEFYSPERVNLWIEELAEIERNSTHHNSTNSDLSYSLLQLPISNSTEEKFTATSNQIWVAFWGILSLAIILATIILIMTASRLMFTYQSNREYSIATAGEGTKILSRTVRKYV